MGLTTWKDAPDGKIQKFDVVVAKNYLSKEELSSGNTDGLAQYIVDMHDEVLQQYIDAVRTGQMMESVALAHTGLTHEGFRLATEVCEHPRQHRKDAFIYMASTTVSQSLICTMLDLSLIHI